MGLPGGAARTRWLAAFAAILLGAVALLAACGPTSGTALQQPTPTATAIATDTATASPTTPPTATRTPRPTPTRTPVPPTATRPAPTATPRPVTVVVDITGPVGGPYGFSPGTITIRVGSSVKWVNMSDTIHTATSAGNWDSGYIAIGGSYTHKFTRAGTYSYACAIHPYMTGTVIVTG